MSSLVRFLAPEAAAAHGIAFTAAHAVGFLLIVVLFSSLTTPFLFRSGFRRGILECGIVLAGVLVILTIIEYVISLRFGYAMFKATPFIGIVRLLRGAVGSSARWSGPASWSSIW